MLDDLREAVVPDGSVLEHLRSLSLVGVLSRNNKTDDDTIRSRPESALVWTCQQDCRYGIMAGKKVFISLDYEAMDLPVESIVSVLDTITRAKHHYHQANTSTASDAIRIQRPFLHHTQLRTAHQDHLGRVHPKGLLLKLLNINWNKKIKFDSLTVLEDRGRPFPPQEELNRYSPGHQIYGVESINMILGHTFNCSIAKQLEDDAALLIDET